MNQLKCGIRLLRTVIVISFCSFVLFNKLTSVRSTSCKWALNIGTTECCEWCDALYICGPSHRIQTMHTISIGPILRKFNWNADWTHPANSILQFLCNTHRSQLSTNREYVQLRNTQVSNSLFTIFAKAIYLSVWLSCVYIMLRAHASKNSPSVYCVYVNVF